MINYSRTTGPIKILMPFVSVLDNLLQDLITLVFRKVIIFRKVLKTCSILVWGEVPL